MDLTVPLYMTTIAEERKLAAAAEKLHVTSSALSQCVKKLENELGVSLFEKIDSRTFTLTTAGKIYVQAAREVLRIRENAYREIQDACDANRGKFAFGCSPKRGLAMFSNVFPRFHKAFPNVKIDLVEANLNNLFEQILDGSIDLAVVTPRDRELELVNSELLDQEEIFFALPAVHPRARRLTVSGDGTVRIPELSAFKDDHWVLSNKGSMHRNLTDEIFKEAGFWPGNVLLETSSTNPHLIAIEEGIAVGFVPVPRGTGYAGIALLHLEPKKYRRLYAVYRRNYRLSESQRFLVDSIREFYTASGQENLPAYRLGW